MLSLELTEYFSTLNFMQCKSLSMKVILIKGILKGFGRIPLCLNISTLGDINI